MNEILLSRTSKKYLSQMNTVCLPTKGVKIQVRVNKTTGKSFITNLGSPNGVSACTFQIVLLFAISLNQAKHETQPFTHYHGYTLLDHLKRNHHRTDHLYTNYQEKESYTRDQKYADDIRWVTTNKTHVKEIWENIPDQLKKRHLHINAMKIENILLAKGDLNNWKYVNIYDLYSIQNVTLEEGKDWLMMLTTN